MSGSQYHTITVRFSDPDFIANGRTACEIPWKSTNGTIKILRRGDFTKEPQGSEFVLEKCRPSENCLICQRAHTRPSTFEMRVSNQSFGNTGVSTFEAPSTYPKDVAKVPSIPWVDVPG